MQKFLDRQSEGDLHPPSLFKIDHINDIVKERGYLWLPNQQDPTEALKSIEGFWIMSGTGDILDCKRSPDTEEDIKGDHLHPSIVTLCKDPFKGLTVNDFSKSRVVCASLEEEDHGNEDNQLKAEAVRPVLRRKEAFNSFARRTYSQFKDCEYNLLDLSSFETRKGMKQYYRDLTDNAWKHTHKTGELREKF